MPTFGISLYSVSRRIVSGEQTPAQAYESLCDLGAEAVELVPFGFNPVTDLAAADALLSAEARRGVPIANYSLNANFLLLSPAEYSAELERVRTHIVRAAELGIPSIRVDSCGFRRPMRENTAEKFLAELPLIAKTYETLSAMAAERGLRLLLENHGFHANGSERVGMILASVNAPNFGLQLDVGNFACVDDRPEIACAKLVCKAKTIHMKDFYIRPSNRDPGGAEEFKCENSWFRSVNGAFLRGSILAQGDLDMWDILSTVKSSGFGGEIYLEYEGMEECGYGTALGFANLKRIWNEV